MSSNDTAVDKEISRRTRRSLLAGGAAALAGTGAWGWLRSRRPDDQVAWPLRVALEANEQVSRDYFRNTRLARTFPAGEAEEPRPNGDIGLEENPNPDWKLMLGSDISLTLGDIKALPMVEIVTELKCIEGWSTVVKWGGARFRDFVTRYAPGQTDLNSYVGLETPGKEYYVGLDMPSAIHPQTLLAYEINGAALTPEHGAPLRLVIPVKYGIKSLKRIGNIAFSNTRPPDYWAERGYDWYAGF
jgi:DMSO/TMAO reductase YedYZ molybdopterin-dependent catalytic subunit